MYRARRAPSLIAMPKPPKIPESVLVVIHTPGLDVLLIERADRAGFWQSVTGSKDTLDEPLAEVFEVWRHEDDLAGDLKDIQPLPNGWHADAEGGGKIALIEELAMAAGQQG